jgi:cyclophilin family peptidyl-prolyl cis-trans isomerase
MRTVRLSVLLAIAAILLVACRQAPAEKKVYTPAEDIAEGSAVMVAEGASPTADIEGSELTETEQLDAPQDDATADDASAEEQVSADDAQPETEQPDDSPEDETAEEEPQDAEEEIEKIPASQLPSRMSRIVKAMFETNKGSFIVAIYPEIAPYSAPHFIMLIREGFYDDVVIHRYDPGYVVQMGLVFDENGIPLYPDYPRKAELAQITIPDEPCISENTQMTISFAKPDAPDSASCQFFINLRDNRKLDELNYGFTVMAQVVHGQNIVRSLRAGDKIGNAQIIEPGLDPSL